MPKKDVLTDVIFTDQTMKVIYPDARMAKGSLMLFSPGHSQGGFAGVPASAAKVPNVSWETAKAILGAGTADSLSGSVLTTGNTAGVFLVERTLKGGVHGISTQSGGQSSARFWSFDFPSAIRDWVYSHRLDHQFFASIWSRTTRLLNATSNSAPQSPFHYMNTNTAGSLFSFQNGIAVNGTNGIGFRAADADSVAGTLNLPKVVNKGVFGNSGTGPGAAQKISAGVGAFDIFGSLNYNKAASKVMYDVYFEDLSVSERSYADADAADLAAHTAAFAPGGKYYGDTWTDPATLP